MAARSPNPRAARRLELARRLLNLPEGTDVLAHLQRLPATDREHARGLVDWVEEYELTEQEVA